MKIKKDRKSSNFAQIKLGECYYNPITAHYCMKIAHRIDEDHPKELDIATGIVYEIALCNTVYPVEAEMNIISEDEYK